MRLWMILVERGGRRREVEEVDVNIGFPLRTPHMYAKASPIYFLQCVWQFMYMDLNKYMNIWLVSAPNQMIRLFKCFRMEGILIRFKGMKEI